MPFGTLDPPARCVFTLAIDGRTYPTSAGFVYPLHDLRHWKWYFDRAGARLRLGCHAPGLGHAFGPLPGVECVPKDGMQWLTGKSWANEIEPALKVLAPSDR